MARIAEAERITTKASRMPCVSVTAKNHANRIHQNREKYLSFYRMRKHQGRQQGRETKRMRESAIAPANLLYGTPKMVPKQ
jgi:hypothetical protein